MDTTKTVTADSSYVKTKKLVIDVKNLKKSFGTQKVLQKISMQLFDGENLVVLGKSGSGKSVLVKCIIRLLEADGGSIDILGENVRGLHQDSLMEMRKKIGFLFQSGALYDSMTVRENLEFPLTRIKKDLTRAAVNEKVKEALENVGLLEAIDKMPAQLSGGMRKRISLARTIVLDPMIMLYDEPTTGLDPITSDEISILINDIQQKYKTSSIIITHDIACARSTANRVVMLHEGQIYQEGSLESFEKSEDMFIKSFFK